MVVFWLIISVYVISFYYSYIITSKKNWYHPLSIGSGIIIILAVTVFLKNLCSLLSWAHIMESTIIHASIVASIICIVSFIFSFKSGPYKALFFAATGLIIQIATLTYAVIKGFL